ncbi:hypothetical protein [Actinomadura macrotermitis]|uniref:Uncharacterized protein n=1 Tax=Actinomadura macrotermitis TaxID=2585200 RepID=A0A7K0BVN6_9ACTN|nr:hypothetical protein [Actinomadura macrotermitis]MQY05239.1 hypothetical protein [Actinomadura macrotermitis]
MAHRGTELYILRSVVVRALIVLLAPAFPVLLTGSAAQAAPVGRTVVIGVPGMMWSDVSAARTPALWRLTGRGGAGGLTVRTTRPNTCPTDGWLTISAGQRSRLEPGDCVLPASPEAAGAGAVAPGWAAIKADNAGTSYHARAGLLGDAVHGAGGCTFAVGPGAVYGLADGSGRVDRYAPSTDKVAPGDWAACPLAAVEVDDLFRAYVAAGVNGKGEPNPVPDAGRAAAAAAADRRVAQVLAGLPEGTTVLVAGISDTGLKPHLRVAIADGPGFARGFVSSGATRQRGMVTLTDLTATVLHTLGIEQPEQAVGSVWSSKASSWKIGRKVDALVDEDVAAQAVRGVQGSFYWVLAVVQTVVYGVAWLLLRRRDAPGLRRRVLGTARVAALMAGAAPAASFLAGLVPWWQAPRPTPVLVCAVAGFSGLLAALALAGPWRRSATAPSLVVAGATVLVLAADVLTGSTLQLNSLMGYTALVAGRFYGFGNQAFALFAVAAVLTAAWLSAYPAKKWQAAGVVAAVGVFAVAVDGLPVWGADFGGVLAMVPVFAMLGVLVTGRRVSPVKLGLSGLAGVALVLAISFVNAQSANPTHLGRFWKDLESGDAWGVVVRKFESMIGSLGFWPVTLLLVAALAGLYHVLATPSRWRPALLERSYEASPQLRAALLCALTVGVLGTLVNDSGVIILSVAFILAVPLTLAVGLRALEAEEASAGTAGPAPAERRSAPAG